MPKHQLQEVIFIGLPGPTHHYGGLSADNVASNLNRGSTSNPKLAAYQALGLARALSALGITVGFLPPQLRPHMATLATYFPGLGEEETIRQAAQQQPALLEKVYSSSAMWVANAATVTPSVDSADGKLHLTVANLYTNLHRRIEAEDTCRVLSAIFDGVPETVVHAPLDGGADLRDEGAANHMRLAPRHSERGIQVYVYGADGGKDDAPSARQTRLAFETIARDHHVPADEMVFVKQHPDVIRAGVFHNDVIAVSNESVLLVHEKAYEGGEKDIERIAAAYQRLHPGNRLNVIMIRSRDLDIDEAVHTYFFNSQIVTRADGKMALIAPSEIQDLYGGKAARLMEAIVQDESNPIAEMRVVDLRQSMHNGGGPACLRLRVPMMPAQIDAVRAKVNVLVNDALLTRLEQIIENQYPSELTAQALADPRLYHRCRAALSLLAAEMRLPLL